MTLGDVLDGGRYQLTGLLGFSHFSSVWLAKDKYNARHPVALKVCISMHAQAYNYTHARKYLVSSHLGAGVCSEMIATMQIRMLCSPVNKATRLCTSTTTTETTFNTTTNINNNYNNSNNSNSIITGTTSEEQKRKQATNDPLHQQAVSLRSSNQ